ncbi:MAG: hypothetical protein K8R58_01325, partial [Bacteroidales bacterium]|nr:hypothetical protein [Bacteroidales bacterium]
MKRFIFLLIVFALPFSTINLFAANPVDSVLQKRNSAYQDYKAFKESMKERTWLNLINLNFKIEDVVKIDDKIIEIYLPAEINKNIELSKQLTELNNEFELLKQKNIEQQNQLKENNDKIQILIIALGFTSLLFIIFLILFINKFLRHKKIQPEINKIEK